MEMVPKMGRHSLSVSHTHITQTIYNRATACSAVHSMSFISNNSWIFTQLKLKMFKTQISEWTEESPRIMSNSPTANGVCCSVHKCRKRPQRGLTNCANRHCFVAPVATISLGSTHRCDDLLPFALPLSACLSILPIKPTDNSMASPLNTQAAPGRGSIMDTSPQEQPPWPYTGTSQTTTQHKLANLFIYFIFGLILW